MLAIRYSLKYDGDTKLSAHFAVREFACKDGSDTVRISPELIELLEVIRSHFNVPIKIMSGYRTKSHNNSVGGALHSQHLLGTAADIQLKGVEPSDVYAWLDGFHTGGLGLYPSFVHVDVRAIKTRWGK